MTATPEPEAPVTGASTADGASPPSRSGRSARLVATGILFSRIAGLVREGLLAQYLGTTVYASAFRAALRMPNVLQNLLGEGTLSASFIPVYSRLLQRADAEPGAAGRLAGAVLALLIAVSAAIALLGVLLAPALVSIFTTGFEGEVREVTIRCVRIIFPMTGILVLSAWALGILNSHRRFVLSYSAPVVWNVAIIAALVAFGTRLSGVDLAVAISWGALAGGILQFLVQLPWVLRLERSLDVRWDTRSPDVKQVLGNAGPAIVGRGGVQLSAYLDQWLASFLFTGAFATMAFAQTLYVLPVSLFGMSVAAAELPEMSRHGEERAGALRDRVEIALRRIAFLVVPSTVAYLLLGDVIVGALYQRGAFERIDTVLVSLVLGAYGLGLLASTSTRLYSSAFYALNDTRTPARIALIRVGIAAVLGATFMFVGERFAIALPLAVVRNTGDPGLRPMGVVGLALAAGIGAWIEWILLRRNIRARLGGLGMGRRVILRFAVAAAGPAILLRAALLLTPTVHPLVTALLVLPVFGVAYLGITRAMGAPEAIDLLDRVLRRRRAANGA